LVYQSVEVKAVMKESWLVVMKAAMKVVKMVDWKAE
jgi:hypothetical protein